MCGFLRGATMSPCLAEGYLPPQGNRRISVNQARKLINDTIRNLPFEEREQYRLPVNDRRVSMQPNVMPRKGFSPRNPNLPSDAR